MGRIPTGWSGRGRGRGTGPAGAVVEESSQSRPFPLIFSNFPPFPATENLITTRGAEYPSLIVYSNGSGGFYVAGGGQRAG